MYIWEQPQWPDFVWNQRSIQTKLPPLITLQDRLKIKSEALPEEVDQNAQLDALLHNAIRTSEIEGEDLNVESVRSSIVHQLGLNRFGLSPSSSPQTDGLIELLLDAIQNARQPLTLERLYQWHTLLFPEGRSLFNDIRIGTLRGNEPMRVVSGRVDRPTIHFEAPPREHLEQELNRFIDWFNHPPTDLDPVIRAAIAHLWLVTLHPFDDGNGRLTRAVTDMALVQALGSSVRFYSLSSAIMMSRQTYYKKLESTQKGELDITSWILWFIQILADSMQQAFDRIDRVLQKSQFWSQHAQTLLNARQVKVLNRLLDNDGIEFTQGISASKYKSIAKVSKATATRDLVDLLEKGCLKKCTGGGRSTRYKIHYL